jgi:hypothetical protein
VAGRAPLIHSASYTLPPYDKAYRAAAALCRRFSWRNVVLMTSDDHYLGVAQSLRQSLVGSGVSIRLHQVFTADLRSDNDAAASRVLVRGAPRV